MSPDHDPDHDPDDHVISLARSGGVMPPDPA